MPGMLDQAQNALPPSSGPGPQTPPTESPNPGNPPLDGASGPGQPPAQGQPGTEVSEDPQALIDQATKIIYGERFDKLVEMFQANGPEKFPRSMAIAVNTAINEIEKDGPISPEAAAELGMSVFTMLLEDMAVEPDQGMPPVVPEVTGEQLQEVLPAILTMYGEAHPEVAKEDLQAVMQQVTGGVRDQMGGDAPSQPPAAGPGAPPALSTGPGPEPSGSPVPPGVV